MAASTATSIVDNTVRDAGQRPALSLAVAPDAQQAIAGVPILARLPNLSLNAGKVTVPAPTNQPGVNLRRWISQTWAQRLLVGSGILLFLVALWPLVGRQTKTEAERTPAPAWQPVPSGVPTVPTLTPPEQLNAGSGVKADAAGPQRPLPKAPAESRREPTSTDAAWVGTGYRAAGHATVAADGPTLYPTASPPAPLVDRRMDLPPETAAPPPGMARLEGIIESPAVRTTFGPSHTPPRY